MTRSQAGSPLLVLAQRLGPDITHLSDVLFALCCPETSLVWCICRSCGAFGTWQRCKRCGSTAKLNVCCYRRLQRHIYSLVEITLVVQAGHIQTLRLYIICILSVCLLDGTKQCSSACRSACSSRGAKWLQDVRTKAALELLERLVVAQQAAEPAAAPGRPPVELKANANGKARLQAAEQSLAGCAPLVVRLATVQGKLGGLCIAASGCSESGGKDLRFLFRPFTRLLLLQTLFQCSDMPYAPPVHTKSRIRCM